MFADKPEEVKPWVDAIAKAIEFARRGGVSTPSSQPAATTQSITNNTPAPTGQSGRSDPPPVTKPIVQQMGSADMSPRVRLSLAKQAVRFLRDPESKVLEFWDIWSDSIPPKDDMVSTSGLAMEFQVATSADMQKLTWRTCGPQNIFIQKMVDFFWNVGAPETEIDRLNDIGALINPIKIGSWIDMSGKGGMDGGWYFPVDMPLKLAVEAADDGEAIRKFREWAESKGVVTVFTVGRDMGAAPPRQTELRFKLPGVDFEDQLRNGIDAFGAFGFPALPSDALEVLKRARTTQPLCMSVITSSEGFVRLGMLVPKPTTEIVLQMCAIAGGNNDEMAAFEGSLGTDGPQYVEYQYLNKGFGYGVYKEGFDIVFHYHVGDERSE